MASVSMAARDNFRVTTDSWVSSQAKSLAVRSVHLPPTRTRLTPRGAYSRCNCTSSARTSMPAGRRAAKAFSSSGASAANSSASRMRNSSARSPALSRCSSSLSPTITRISATFPIGSYPLLPIPRVGCHCSGSLVFAWIAILRALPLAQVKRRERTLLMHFHVAFAHQFEHRGEARGEHRRPVRRVGQIVDEILIERAPVQRLADQPLKRLACLGKRPDRALWHANERPRLSLPPPGIGRQQVVERRRPLRPLDLGDGLRLATLENVAAKLRPIDHLLGEFPDRLEAPQPLRQRIGHVLGADTFGRMRLRQQQARFQISEPRRHHQVIGGKFQPHFAGRVDEGEVLVGKRENGDLGEVDLLLARQRQQKVERAFKALDIDHQRRLVGRALGQLGFELIFVRILGHHAEPAAGSTPAINLKNSARRPTTSIGAAGFRCASAAAARRAASPASWGAAAATAIISSILPLQCRIISQPAAIAELARSASEPDSAAIETSSLIRSPENPIESRITCCTIVTEVVAGATGSIALNTTCAVIPSGRPASVRNAAKSVSSSVARSVPTTGSFWWLSAVARPWPGMCLSTGRTPPSIRPAANAPAMAATFSGVVP